MDIFGHVWTHSDTFGSARMHLGAFRCVGLIRRQSSNTPPNFDNSNSNENGGGRGGGAAAPRTPFKIAPARSLTKTFWAFLDVSDVSDVSDVFERFSAFSGVFRRIRRRMRKKGYHYFWVPLL